MMAVLLAGCATVGPDFTSPSTLSPSRYRAVESTGGFVFAGESAGPPWWTSFGAADLDTLVAAALKGSPTIAEAEAALDSARAAAAVVEGASSPQVGLSSGVERARINGAAFGFDGFPNRTISRYSVGSRVSYDL
ncbi:MAG: TolC family protein, partial [Lacisediminimonas sp.]|nr:TolC family protein [Lacisediminimonas sp.]